MSSSAKKSNLLEQVNVTVHATKPIPAVQGTIIDLVQRPILSLYTRAREKTAHVDSSSAHNSRARKKSVFIRTRGP